MGGGLMQLVAYGAQDVYLTGNPQITFFKVVYRRHTNFSMESIKQVWAGGATSGSASATISRNGDLVYGLHMQMDLIGTTAGKDYGSLPHRSIDTIECEIGGQLIDRQYGEWLEIHHELTEPYRTLNVANCMNGYGPTTKLANGKYGRFHVPLKFWFCRNPGLALPLIALQYHEVKINLVYDDNFNGIYCNVHKNHLYADYIYLDTDERRRFAQVSHEYLIEQLQRREFSGVNSVMDLTFNHPVKELIWNRKHVSNTEIGYNSLPGTQGRDEDAWEDTRYILKLNGHDRFSERPLEYFTQYQVWRHHTSSILSASAIARGDGGDRVAVYSFALKPEEHQPSGTCNFSRIDSAQLIISNLSTTPDINVYAINYNVLRVMSGMGGLAYSN